MDRRSLFKSIALGLAALKLRPETLLAKPARSAPLPALRRMGLAQGTPQQRMFVVCQAGPDVKPGDFLVWKDRRNVTVQRAHGSGHEIIGVCVKRMNHVPESILVQTMGRYQVRFEAAARN